MTLIIYQSPTWKEEEYLINKQHQNILSYLYLFGGSTPQEISEKIDLSDATEVLETAEGVLTESGTGFISIKTTGQLTISGERTQQFRLTSQGRDFVERYQSRIAAPFTITSYIEEMERTQKELRELLRQMEDLLYDPELEKEGERSLKEIMVDIENEFDEIRENRDHSSY